MDYECFPPNLPHYLYFLVLVNQFTFFNISCVYTKVTKQKQNNVLFDDNIEEEKSIYKQNAYRAIGNILYPIFVWFCIKHKYYDWFTLSMLLMIVASISSQITFFLNPVVTGKVFYQLSA